MPCCIVEAVSLFHHSCIPVPRRWCSACSSTGGQTFGCNNLACRILEWFRLEGTLKIVWFQPPCCWQGLHFPHFRVLSSSLGSSWGSAFLGRPMSLCVPSIACRPCWTSDNLSLFRDQQNNDKKFPHGSGASARCQNQGCLQSNPSKTVMPHFHFERSGLLKSSLVFVEQNLCVYYFHYFFTFFGFFTIFTIFKTKYDFIISTYVLCPLNVTCVWSCEKF